MKRTQNSCEICLINITLTHPDNKLSSPCVFSVALTQGVGVFECLRQRNYFIKTEPWIQYKIFFFYFKKDNYIIVTQI